MTTELAQRNAKLFASYGPPRRSENEFADAIFDLCGFIHEMFVAHHVAFSGGDIVRIKKAKEIFCSDCGEKIIRYHIYQKNFCEPCLNGHKRKMAREKYREKRCITLGGEIKGVI